MVSIFYVKCLIGIRYLIMESLFNNGVKPLEVMSEGRLFKRFVRDGTVSITFSGQTVTGNLVNLSVSGLLADFSSRGPLPGMSDNIIVRLEAESTENILDLPGTVVRMQVPGDYQKQDLIEMAVNFSELEPSLKAGLQKLIKYLLVRTITYKT
jgi:hypothetical protein